MLRWAGVIHKLLKDRDGLADSGHFLCLRLDLPRSGGGKLGPVEAPRGPQLDRPLMTPAASSARGTHASARGEPYYREGAR